ncbi:hypothetical protein AKJ09_08178 [Labilithrix luteola]|uniref:Uncharacterized protein n=1 Tax=Labilithrix luteola TaxID=1391654 RepID=A0A0K1Q7X7_9BACT|nr:hypothetical protein [Labilithrix luteola]AKV01515.1 hypothetical protein AKJ09_08178 [Labilithrix luteola]
MLEGKRSAVQRARSAVELQEDLMRFEGRFSARLASAFEPLVESQDPAVGVRATRDQLDFMASALDIAVGSSPEVDLLDMVTLVALGREAMARRWKEDVHGPDTRRVTEAFRTSFDDISTIARTVISADVEAQLGRVIREWMAENPRMENVATVRLSAYAENREANNARTAAGLFSLVRGAAQAADTAILLGERALYATQRLPVLVRMHARITSKTIFADLRRDRMVKRIFVNAFLACSGVAVVSAMSWLVARVVHARLVGR